MIYNFLLEKYKLKNVRNLYHVSFIMKNKRTLKQTLTDGSVL